ALSMTRLLLTPTLFPYTTLFRSNQAEAGNDLRTQTRSAGGHARELADVLVRGLVDITQTQGQDLGRRGLALGGQQLARHRGEFFAPAGRAHAGEQAPQRNLLLLAQQARARGGKFQAISPLEHRDDERVHLRVPWSLRDEVNRRQRATVRQRGISLGGIQRDRLAWLGRHDRKSILSQCENSLMRHQLYSQFFEELWL